MNANAERIKITALTAFQPADTPATRLAVSCSSEVRVLMESRDLWFQE